MKQDLSENKQIRIFISSTFGDMKAERDYLITKVIPSLQHYCNEKEFSLTNFDMRTDISEEETKQGKVLEICLKEAITNNPFFIGLLGERYGWIPSEENKKSMTENTSVLGNFPWLADKFNEGSSLTDMIQEGVLRSKEQMNACFYIRSKNMETAPEFTEKSGSSEEKKLLSMKKALREQEVYKVKEYDSIEHLGKLVEEDFKKVFSRVITFKTLL